MTFAKELLEWLAAVPPGWIGVFGALAGAGVALVGSLIVVWRTNAGNDRRLQVQLRADERKLAIERAHQVKKDVLIAAADATSQLHDLLIKRGALIDPNSTEEAIRQAMGKVERVAIVGAEATGRSAHAYLNTVRSHLVSSFGPLMALAEMKAQASSLRQSAARLRSDQAISGDAKASLDSPPIQSLQAIEDEAAKLDDEVGRTMATNAPQLLTDLQTIARHSRELLREIRGDLGMSREFGFDESDIAH